MLRSFEGLFGLVTSLLSWYCKFTLYREAGFVRITVSWYSLYRFANPITPLPTANYDFYLSLVVAVDIPFLGVFSIVDYLVEIPGLPRQVIELRGSITKRAWACSFGFSFTCRSLTRVSFLFWEKGLPSEL